MVPRNLESLVSPSMGEHVVGGGTDCSPNSLVGERVVPQASGWENRWFFKPLDGRLCGSPRPLVGQGALSTPLLPLSLLKGPAGLLILFLLPL